MHVHFSTFTRNSLTLLSSRATLRQLRAALASAQVSLPRPYFLPSNGDRLERFCELGINFMQGTCHRCSFSVQFLHRAHKRRGSIWYNAKGQPRALKPSRWDNPLSSALNRSLCDQDPFRPLTLWERALLALGF